uniref:Kinesin motor domain-containing protein n=1 Tax=Timema bartmani TaxID=61472 RepID=A0A7R9F0X6_9NEOP|nr:unnamed protein product [Timema bartmani]
MHQTARKFRVKVTFIEVYEETVRDLLNTSNFKEELIILEDKHGSLFISGLEEIECQTVSEVFNWLHIGMSNKQVSWMTLQQRSNHCHSVFTLSLEQEWIANGGVHHLHSKAQFTDLAGSEHIILPICLDQTWRQERSFDFPNTQSLLTRILKNSFGGTANTLVVCCVSPTSLDFDETMKTLHFSIRVRNIINVLTMNQYNNEAVAREQPQKQQITDDPNIFQELKMDTFGLEFAASQWLKLASNAGELLTKLSNKKNLSNEEREEIDHWLCLKQECEEVLGSENDIFVKPFERRTLNRIDEMTESEDQTSDERAHYETSNDSDTSIQQIGESLSESDMDFQPDFLDKLDNFIQTFKRKTDANVGNIRDDYDLKDNKLNSSIIPTITTKRKPLENIVEVEGEEENERKNDSLNKISLVKYSGSLDTGRKFILEDKNLDISKSYANFTYSPKENKSPLPIKKTINMEKNEDTIHVIEQEKVLLASMDSSALPKPLIKLQMLSAENEAKQYQIRQVLIDLDSAHKRIEELQNTIQIKEKFIDDLIRNSNMRATAKERCQRKSNKLEEEYYKTRTNLAQAENALLLNVHDSDPDKEKLKHKQEIEKYKKITVHYEKRLKDIEFIKQIAGDSAKNRPLYLSSTLAQAAPPTLSTTWTAPQSMFSKLSVTISPLYSAPFFSHWTRPGSSGEYLTRWFLGQKR